MLANRRSVAHRIRMFRPVMERMEPRATPTTVNLTFPDSGSWNIGQTINIQATSSAPAGISHVQVELYQGGTGAGNQVGVLYTSPFGGGNVSSYNWKIPATVNGQSINGTNYKIKWVAWDNSPQ